MGKTLSDRITAESAIKIANPVFAKRNLKTRTILRLPDSYILYGVDINDVDNETRGIRVSRKTGRLSGFQKNNEKNIRLFEKAENIPLTSLFQEKAKKKKKKKGNVTMKRYFKK
jgi:hypothetical protein